MPTRKITSVALAGALSIILVWAVKHFANVDIPGEVGQALTVVLSVVTGYVVPDAE